MTQHSSTYSFSECHLIIIGLYPLWYLVQDDGYGEAILFVVIFHLNDQKYFIFIKKEQQHASRILLQGHIKFFILYSKAVHQQLDGLTLS